MRAWSPIPVLGLALAAACGGEAPPPSTEPYQPPAEVSGAAQETFIAALDEFGACMSLEVFIKTGIYKLYKGVAYKVGEGPQTCGACHTPNAVGVCMGNSCIGDDVMTMFDSNRTFPGVMRIVTGTLDDEGNFNDLVPSYRYRDKGRLAMQYIDPPNNPENADQCVYPDGTDCHPHYDMEVMNPELDLAIGLFTEEAIRRWKLFREGDEFACRAAYQLPEE
jgi:hypothetical protein